MRNNRRQQSKTLQEEIDKVARLETDFMTWWIWISIQIRVNTLKHTERSTIIK